MKHGFGSRAVVLALMCFGGVSSAMAQSDTLDTVQANALPQIRSYFQEHCQAPEAGGVTHQPDFQSGMLDGDDLPDLYVDIDPDLLKVRQCTTEHVRLEWLSSLNYAMQATSTSGAPFEKAADPGVVDTGSDSSSPQQGNAQRDEEINPTANLNDPGSPAALDARERAEAAVARQKVHKPTPAEIENGRRAASILAAIAVSVLFLGMITFWLTTKFLGVSADRYGYRPILNFANGLYIMIVPLIIAGIIYPAMYPLLIGGLVLWGLRTIINIKRTNLSYGLVLSVAQIILVPFILIGGFFVFKLFGVVTKKQEFQSV